MFIDRYRRVTNTHYKWNVQSDWLLLQQTQRTTYQSMVRDFIRKPCHAQRSCQLLFRYRQTSNRSLSRCSHLCRVPCMFNNDYSVDCHLKKETRLFVTSVDLYRRKTRRLHRDEDLHVWLPTLPMLCFLLNIYRPCLAMTTHKTEFIKRTIVER